MQKSNFGKPQLVLIEKKDFLNVNLQMSNKLNYVTKSIKLVIVMKVCFNISNWSFCKEKKNNAFYLNFVS